MAYGLQRITPGDPSALGYSHENLGNFVPFYPGSKTQLGLIQQILADHLGPMAGDYFPTSPIAARKSA